MDVTLEGARKYKPKEKKWEHKVSPMLLDYYL